MRILVALVLVIVGVLAVVVAVLYFTEAAHSLPSFFPGHLAHGTGKRTKHGIAAVVVGAVLIVVGIVVGFSGSRRDRW